MYLQRALDVQAESPDGERRPELAAAFDTLGGCLRALGRHKEALPHLLRALDVYRMSLPASHPCVSACHHSVGVTLTKLGEHDQALTNHEMALEMRQSARSKVEDEGYGGGDAMIADSHNHVSGALLNLHRLDEALAHQHLALAGYKAALGPDHLEVAVCLTGMSATLGDLGHHPLALETDLEALAILKQRLGPTHPDVGTCLSNIGMQACT